MGTDHDKFRALMLANVRMQLANKHAVLTLGARVNALEGYLRIIGPISDPDTIAAMAEVSKSVDEAYSNLAAQTDGLISALEDYVNG